MNRFLDWVSEHLTDLGVMVLAFGRGFAKGIRK